ncbi:MAG TPA: triphosphoribosyl-dephospho-CoA synthase, partial [Gemmatimonadales bacterium]|nr:triphosphoribosyl-dephospho-CoA synthase [Gemmatimonadales bacterium]
EELARRLGADHDDLLPERLLAGDELACEQILNLVHAPLHEMGDPFESTVATYLALLAAEPDTLIARKLGRAAAEAVSAEARAIVALGGPANPEAAARVAAFDLSLRDPQNSRNPGTTADLTAAALFAVLAEDAVAADSPRMPRAQ